MITYLPENKTTLWLFLGGNRLFPPNLLKLYVSVVNSIMAKSGQ